MGANGLVGAANDPKRKLFGKGYKKGEPKAHKVRTKRGAAGHRMDREMNTPKQGGPWGQRIYVG